MRKLELEILEDRTAPSDLTAIGVELIVAYPVYGQNLGVYDTQQPTPIPFFTPPPPIIIAPDPHNPPITNPYVDPVSALG